MTQYNNTTEETQEMLGDLIVKVLGKPGRMRTGKNVLYDLTIMTPDMAPLWFGDIDRVDDLSKIEKLLFEPGVSNLLFMTPENINHYRKTGEIIPAITFSPSDLKWF